MLLLLLNEMLTLIGGLIVFYFLYLFISRRHDKPASNSQSMAQTTLRDLVERVVDEARKLPGLGTSEPAKKQHEQHFSEQSYGDLLTTAIVNKVIEKYQDESLDGNSNVLNGKSLHGQTDEDFGHEGEQGYESSQPLSHNEHSSEYGAVPSKRPRNRRSPLSLTIEERIEEVTTYTSDEESPLNLENRLDFRNARRVPFPEFGIDIIDPFRESSDESHDEPESPTNVDIVTPMESWEENWLFQKKKIHTRSEPVSMLVPNPSADFRALIGDTDADDTSDLSECSVHSDDEVETELTLAISKVVPNLIDSDLEILDVDITDKLLPNTSKKEKTELPKIVKSEGNETEIDEKFEMLLKSNAIELEMPLEPRANNSVVAEWNKLVSESEKDILEKSCTAGMTKMLQNEEENKKLKNLTLELETPMIKSSKSVDNSILELPKTPASTPVANSSEDNNKMMITDLQTLQEKLDSFGEENKESDQKEEQSYTETSALQNDIYTAKPYFENGTDVPELNGFQQESEYTVHDVIATQRHIAGASKGLRISIGSDVTDNPVPEISLPVASSPPPSESSGKCREAAASVQKSDDPLFTPPRPGTIAEREHKKWENAAPIENNPYSEENIQKRLMERQYTRRSADLSGNNSELPKISDNVQILFGGHKPDVRRFGRDYYVNEAKTPSYEKTRRSTTTSSSSRPTSSLSQHSNSTCSDVEPQVSYVLAKLEEVSLRNNLHRRSYNSPNSTSHFVTNPLLHLENPSNPSKSKREMSLDADSLNHSTRTANEKLNTYSRILATKQVDNLSVDHETGSNLDERDGETVLTNPLFENTENSSIVESENSPCEIAEDEQREPKDNQISSIYGKRYWHLNPIKYYTFGGIKSSPFTKYDKNEEEQENEDTSHDADIVDEFWRSSENFSIRNHRTFGGIHSYSKKKSERNPKKSKRQRPTVIEYFDGMGRYELRKIPRFIQTTHKLRSENFSDENQNSSECFQKNQHFKEEEKEDIEDAIDPDLVLKFLMDPWNPWPGMNSPYPMSKDSAIATDDEKESFRVVGIGQDNKKEQTKELRLEPPLVPEIVERRFETLRDLRRSNALKDSGPCEKKDRRRAKRLEQDTAMW